MSQKSDVPLLKKCLVTTFMAGGSLSSYIHEVLSSPSEVVPSEAFFRLAGDVALALHYLHLRSPPVVHLDVKSSNVLLDAGRRAAKLCDFGEEGRVGERKGLNAPCRH